jgi:exosome complex component RRP42
MEVSSIQKKRIIDYLKQGKRLDGRKAEEYRKIEVKTGISNKAEGSCSVKFGNTEVYAGVKMDIGTPYPDSADAGNLSVGAELGPIASSKFELGPPKINAIELSRVLDRGIRESKLIDFKKLCITKGEKVWNVYVDIYAINDDGNLIDVAGLAAIIAITTAKMPVYNEETKRIEHEWTNNSLPLNKENLAFNITLSKIDETIIVDPSREEEEIADYRISLAVADDNGEPKITSIQKGKEVAISTEEMNKILQVLEERWRELFPQVLKHAWK